MPRIGPEVKGPGWALFCAGACRLSESCGKRLAERATDTGIETPSSERYSETLAVLCSDPYADATGSALILLKYNLIVAVINPDRTRRSLKL
jgi:hypothetical protein